MRAPGANCPAAFPGLRYAARHLHSSTHRSLSSFKFHDRRALGMPLCGSVLLTCSWPGCSSPGWAHDASPMYKSGAQQMAEMRACGRGVCERRDRQVNLTSRCSHCSGGRQLHSFLVSCVSGVGSLRRLLCPVQLHFPLRQQLPALVLHLHR